MYRLCGLKTLISERVLCRAVAALSVLMLANSGGCSTASPREGFEDEDAGGGFHGNPDGGTCNVNNTSTDLDRDTDGDGYPLRLDCNECDPNINVGAFDLANNGIDEDCSGTADDEPKDCDKDLPLSAPDAFHGARAIGLCKSATTADMWGVVRAEWVRPDGSAQTERLSEGALPKFGATSPQAGAAMLAISTGSARSPSQPGYRSVTGWTKGYTSGTPAGYPKESKRCASATPPVFGSSFDGAALRVRVRVPSNAKSFKFQQNFFTFEFPNYICKEFNDFFVTIMDPKPAGLPDGNIAFDQDGNPISVNNSLLQVCAPQVVGDTKFPCPLGEKSLAGTGFDGHAATGWLTTTAPVEKLRGREITLMWTIWDQGDGNLDSTALIDGFEWSVEAKTAGTIPTPR